MLPAAEPMTMDGRERVREAMAAVPRETFLPPDLRDHAHVDAPLPIGAGQTNSAPHMVAIMAEALDVRPGHRMLEVGGGSGWHAAVLARLASPGGRVVSMEYVPDLAQVARRNLHALGLPVEVVEGDGSLGWPAAAPYDRISVAAAAPAVPPPLLAQLAPDGILVIPVGSLDMQTLLRVRADGSSETLMPVRFVPLRGEHGWP